jgi:sugar/nucleoside kinase (ribokinase family)
MRRCSYITAAVLFFSSSSVCQAATGAAERRSSSSILVAGSLNADTFLPISRFPSSGENLTLLPNVHPLVDVPGGKGCNQAIACAKLSTATNSVAFLGQFGNDAASEILKAALTSNNVDIKLCGKSKVHPSGRGYVMIVPKTGEVSAVISPGSNFYGWSAWGVTTTKQEKSRDEDDDDDSLQQPSMLTDEQIEGMVSSFSLLQVQCEVPNLVNLRLAQAAKKLDIPVLLDVGGEDRRMDRELLQCCDYLIPNETELERLASHYDDEQLEDDIPIQKAIDQIQPLIGKSLDVSTLLKNTRRLQKNGANNVLVTLGAHGSILVTKHSSILYQPSCPLPSGSSVVDETGAGDCYRAGFAVALLQQRQCGVSTDDDEILVHCMKFASAAGALAVTKNGAVPSIPSLKEVETLLSTASVKGESANCIPRGGGNVDDDFPIMFGSRINSMKDRLDLVSGDSLPMNSPRDWLRRQATIHGLGCVDFNYPQHFHDWEPEEAKKALDEANLVAGAVCLRYPSKFARGAMNHPDAQLRREAVEITKQAAKVAKILGCNEVVVWSAFDGFDYPFQVDYKEKWNQIVEAFQECCDAYPDIRWSLEFKPTDEYEKTKSVPLLPTIQIFDSQGP